VRVEVVRSGGFANLKAPPAVVDTDDLSPEEAARLTDLVGRADLAAAAARPRAPVRGADRYQYDVTVTEGTRREHVTVGEGELSPELRALVQDVVGRARG
jgi:hypothetical protein